jgi:hypothetical protein
MIRILYFIVKSILENEKLSKANVQQVGNDSKTLEKIFENSVANTLLAKHFKGTTKININMCSFRLGNSGHYYHVYSQYLDKME